MKILIRATEQQMEFLHKLIHECIEHSWDGIFLDSNRGEFEVWSEGYTETTEEQEGNDD